MLFLSDEKGRRFKAISTPKEITKYILLDDISQKMYANVGSTLTVVVPYDKLNLASGFSKINY